MKLMLNAEERQQLVDLGYSEEEAKTDAVCIGVVDGKSNVYS